MRKERKINLDGKTKGRDHQSNQEKEYELKVGNLLVEINYATNHKKMDECMLAILKQKISE